MPVKLRTLPVEVCWRELTDAFRRFCMNAFVAGREGFHGSGALDAGRAHVGLKSSLLDAPRRVGVDLGEMPGKFAERAGLRIGTEVILAGRKRAQQVGGFLRFVVPES